MRIYALVVVFVVPGLCGLWLLLRARLLIARRFRQRALLDPPFVQCSHVHLVTDRGTVRDARAVRAED